MLKFSCLRTIFGFIFAPISPIILVIMFETIFNFYEGSAFGNLEEIIWEIKFFGLVGYPIAFVFGVPLYFFFRWQSWNGILTYIVAGAFLGIVTHLTRDPVLDYSIHNLSGRVYVSFGILFGTVASIAFWLIVRPDKIKTYRFWDET